MSPLVLTKVNFFRQFCQFVGLSYNFMVDYQGPSTPFRAYIAKGNNSHLVRTVLRARFWWTVDEEMQPGMSYHLIWTQVRNNNVLEAIRQERHDDFEGLNYLRPEESSDTEDEERRTNQRSQSLSQTAVCRGDREGGKDFKEFKDFKDEDKKPRGFITSKAQCVAISLRKLVSATQLA